MLIKQRVDNFSGNSWLVHYIPTLCFFRNLIAELLFWKCHCQKYINSCELCVIQSEKRSITGTLMSLIYPHWEAGMKKKWDLPARASWTGRTEPGSSQVRLAMVQQEPDCIWTYTDGGLGPLLVDRIIQISGLLRNEPVSWRELREVLENLQFGLTLEDQTAEWRIPFTFSGKLKSSFCSKQVKLKNKKNVLPPW